MSFTNGNAVADSTALAALEVPIEGVEPGTRVFNEDVGADFVYTISTAALDPDVVVAVAGITGARWIKSTALEAPVTNADLATMAAHTIKGNATAGSATPTDLTANDVRDLTNLSTHAITTGVGSAAAPTYAVGGVTNSGVFGDAGSSQDVALCGVGNVALYYNNAGGCVVIPRPLYMDVSQTAGIRFTGTDLLVKGLWNVQIGADGALATNADNGFLTLPTCNGTPVGNPTLGTGKAAVVVDTSAGKLWAYYGGSWHDLTGA